MKKTIIYLAAAAMFTACSSDIDFAEPDNMTDEITFSVGDIGTPSKIASRAGEHNHTAWDADVHANTLGVFGFCEGGTNIFTNQKVAYNGSKWEYTPKKYWQEYINKTSFDFFGYMVEDADLPSDAALTSSGSCYTLSFPASIETPILTSADNTPLICHAPLHRPFQKLALPFEMDQTLTGYCLQFQLGEKMDHVRDFVITSVKIHGKNLPTGGTVSRTYTFDGSTWTAGDVKWSVTKSEATHTFTIESGPLTVRKDLVQWGDAFFVIPSSNFSPTIEVTYDVVANDDHNADGSTITRKDVKSTIILNKTNFSNLTTGTTGEINPIKIKIVPDYLYVLSDDDHATGVLVVE